MNGQNARSVLRREALEMISPCLGELMEIMVTGVINKDQQHLITAAISFTVAEIINYDLEKRVAETN